LTESKVFKVHQPASSVTVLVLPYKKLSNNLNRNYERICLLTRLTPASIGTGSSGLLRVGRKHLVSFEEAATVFLLDEFLSTSEDPDHADRERRFITVGLSAKRRLLTICHTERGESIRIISARPVTRHEREIYEEH